MAKCACLLSRETERAEEGRKQFSKKAGMSVAKGEFG